MNTKCYRCRRENRKTGVPHCILSGRATVDYDQDVECVNFVCKREYAGKEDEK